jgi:prolyl-tRNA editing enzyme YbaK/EbsC (Cys-tRNA(Pro) deacylase)
MTVSERKVIEAVNTLGIPYELITIDPAYADTAAFCEHYGYPQEQSGNTIIVASKKAPKKFAACVVLATTQLDVNRRVKQLLGVGRASFASAEEMQAVTGMQIGGVTPFTLPAELPLYVDARIMQLDWVILGSGGRSSKIKLSPEVFHKLGAEIIPSLGIERSDTSSTS